MTKILEEDLSRLSVAYCLQEAEEYQDSICERIILRWILGRKRSMGRTGFGWIRIGSSGSILWAR